MSSSRICVVGPLPPPRHGVSAVNEAVVFLLRGRGGELDVLNTAPAGLGRGLGVRLSRWRRLLRAGFDLVRLRGDVAYFSLSGGYGLLYEIALAALARCAGRRLIVHHHSFRYLDEFFAPMSWFVRVTGPSTVHVVLGSNMGRRLQERYPRVGRTLVLSNAVFLPGKESAAMWESRRAIRIGHLSNLSPEKGLWDVLATARIALDRGHAWEFVLAGPFESVAVAEEFARRAVDLTNVLHIGPVYSGAKDEFLAGVGVLLFPTRYRHEAEPLVIHEGLRAGCAVVAFDRGCISGLVDDSCGRLVPRTADFASTAIEGIEQWSSDPVAGATVSAGARRRAATLKTGAEAARIEFLALFDLSGSDKPCDIATTSTFPVEAHFLRNTLRSDAPISNDKQ